MLRKTIIKIYILFAIIISFNFIHAASYEWNIGGLKQMDYDSIEGEEVEVELTFYCGVNNAMEGGALSAAGKTLVYGNLANNYYTGIKSENGGKSWTKLNNGYSLGTNVYIKDVGLFSIEDRGGSSDFNQTNRMDLFVARKDGESDSDWEKRTNSYGRVKVKAKILKSGTERIWEWPSGNSTASSVSNSNVVSGKNTGINTKVIYNNLRVVTKTGEKPAPLTTNCKDAVELSWNKLTTLSGEGAVNTGSNASGDMFVTNPGAEVLSSSENKQILGNLFDGAIPTTESQMAQWLTNIQVPYIAKDGTRKTRNLAVHRKLAQNFIGALTELADSGFKAYSLGTYCFRKVNNGTGSNTLSQHSYGVAIDINPAENYYPGVTSGLYQPGVNEYSLTDKEIAIMNKYGFRWGGNYKDYMHFSISGR